MSEPDISVSDFIAAAKIIEGCGWEIKRPNPKRVHVEVGATGRPARFYVQDWACDLSPIGKCVGDSDDQENSCVFCGSPEERK